MNDTPMQDKLSIASNALAMTREHVILGSTLFYSPVSHEHTI